MKKKRTGQPAAKTRSLKKPAESVIWTNQGKKDCNPFCKTVVRNFFLSVCSSLRVVVSIVEQVMIDGFDVLEIVKSQITQSGAVVGVRDGG